MLKRPEFREGIAGTLTAALGAAVLIGSLQIPTVFGFNYGPGFFPSLIGIALIGAGVVQFLTSLLRAPVDPVPVPFEQSDVGANGWRPLVVFCLMLILTWVMPRVGFHLTAPIALVLLFVLFRVPWQAAIFMAIVLTFVMDAIFRALLLVPLPWGVLTPWTGALAWRF
jgi:putative tricarboxylic transport membrane protein